MLFRNPYIPYDFTLHEPSPEDAKTTPSYVRPDRLIEETGDAIVALLFKRRV